MDQINQHVNLQVCIKSSNRYSKRKNIIFHLQPKGNHKGEKVKLRKEIVVYELSHPSNWKASSLRVCGWFLYNYSDQLKPCPQWLVGIGSGRFPRIRGITFCCFWPTIRCHVLWLSLWWLKMNVNVSNTGGNCPLVMPTNKCGRDITRIGSGHVCWMKERPRERYVCMQRSSPSSLITY